jgi:primosomal protein N'
VSSLDYENKSILIILPRKGDIAGYFCHDCDFYSERNFLKCKICHGVDIRPYGLGVETVCRAIKKHFPKLKCQIIDQRHPGKVMCSCVIATYQIFDYWQQFDHSFVVGFDSQFSRPDPLANEQFFRLLVRTFNRTRQTMFIVTRLSSQIIFSYLSRPKDAYQYFLRKRQIIKAYPFGKIIKLSFSSQVDNFAIARIHKMKGVISVSAAHHPQLSKNQWQVLITTVRNFEPKALHQVFNFDRQLPIDVDPPNFL